MWGGWSDLAAFLIGDTIHGNRGRNRVGQRHREQLRHRGRGGPYFADRSIAAWTGTQAVKEAALIRATDWMQGEFGPQWKGWRKTNTQALDWPRVGVTLDDVGAYGTGAYVAGFAAQVSDTIVPDEVKRACMELALRALTATLSPDIARVKRSAGVGSARVEYDPFAPVQTTFPVAYRLLRRYLDNATGPGMIEIAR